MPKTLPLFYKDISKIFYKDIWAEMCEGIRINSRLRFRKEYNFWCSKIVNTIQLYMFLSKPYEEVADPVFMFLSKPYKILHFSKWEN